MILMLSVSCVAGDRRQRSALFWKVPSLDSEVMEMKSPCLYNYFVSK